jgi:hypothetical protein
VFKIPVEVSNFEKWQGIKSELPLKLPLKTVFAVTENATRRVFIAFFDLSPPDY